jgi:ATP-binding cassette, subfamily B, bacterial PglK
VRRLLDVIRRAYIQIGTERRWRWYLLAGISLSMTAVEAIGAALVYLLVALISSPDATVQLPVLGDLASLFPGFSPRQLRIGAAGFVGAFFLGRALVLLAQKYVQNRLVANSSAILAGELLEGYLSMPYLFHTQKSSAELIRNTYGGVEKLLNSIIMPALSVVTQIILSLSLLVTLIVLAPAAMLLTTTALGLTLLSLQSFVRPSLVELSRQSEEAGKQSIGAIQQSLGGIRDIKLLQREDAFSRVHLTQRFILARSNYTAGLLSSLSPIAIETSVILAIVGVFVLTTTGSGGSQGALATLAVFAYVGLRLQPALQAVIGYVNKINNNVAMLEIIEADRAQIADWRASVASERIAGTADVPSTLFEREIRVEAVSFRYRPDLEPVLQDVDLTIRKGEFIGICGPTGGGKSTLVDLIVGLLQPTKAASPSTASARRRPLWWWGQLGRRVAEHLPDRRHAAPQHRLRVADDARSTRSASPARRTRAARGLRRDAARRARHDRRGTRRAALRRAASARRRRPGPLPRT